MYICTQINETPITSMSLSPTCVRIERIFVKVSFEAVFRAGSYSYQLTAGGKNSLLGRRRRGDDKIELLKKEVEIHFLALDIMLMVRMRRALLEKCDDDNNVCQINWMALPSPPKMTLNGVKQCDTIMMMVLRLRIMSK